MFSSGSVGGAVGPVTGLLLSTCGCSAGGALRVIGNCAAAPEFDEKRSHGGPNPRQNEDFRRISSFHPNGLSRATLKHQQLFLERIDGHETDTIR